MQTFYPLITSLVALVFAVLVLKQYLTRRWPHQLAWAGGKDGYLLVKVVTTSIFQTPSQTRFWNTMTYSCLKM